MIVFADESRKAELMEIWKQSFGDSDEYIRMFFDCNFSKIKVLVYEVDKKAVSVAYFLPATYISEEDKSILCWYLYAAATLPEFRNRGYFGQIMKTVSETFPEPVFLVPGEESLISYYKKQGMQVWQEAQSIEVALDAGMISTFCKDNSEFLCDNGKFKIYFKDLNATEYISKRKDALSKSIHIAWNDHFMRYICHENKFCGGFQKEICVNGQKHITTYRVEGDVLKVLEMLPCKENLEQTHICIQALMEENNCKKAVVCLQPTVMIIDKWDLCKERGYFNLTLG